MRLFDGTERAEGFTLLELVVVMTLLTIMAMTVTPVFRGSFGFVRGDHAMRDLFAAMKGAQADAVTEAAEFRVYVDVEAEEYWIAREVRDEEDAAGFEVVEGRGGEKVRLPDVLDVVEAQARRGDKRGTYYVGFYPGGSCDVSNLEVAVGGDEGRVYRIETTGTRVTFEAPEE